MDDVKPTTDVAPQATGAEAETASQPTPTVENKTAEAAGGSQAPAPQQDRTVPYQALSQERQLRKELQRQLAELKAQAQPQYQNPAEGGDDWEKIISHPYVQNLMLQQAKRELTDYAREVLDEFPQIPDAVKKAILKNPRGYVQESTTDIENAKLDLREYVESLSEAGNVAPTAKTFPVAATNTTGTQTAVRPAEVQKILNKPMDEWTKEEEQIVAEFQANMPKK